MNRRGFSIIQILMALVVTTAGFYLVSQISGDFTRQEKAMQTRMSGEEVLSFVAGQYQAMGLDQARCHCCRALGDPLPADVALTRPAASACDALCAAEKPVHGFRAATGAPSDGSKPQDVFVTVESCAEEAQGQALAFVLYGRWSDAQLAQGYRQSRIKFVKSRW